MTDAVPMLLFAGIVAAAFAVEATLGFGSTLIAVSLGVFLLPLDELLPAFVPANLVLSTAIAGRYRKQIDLGLLGRRILPLMALGMPAGMLLGRVADEHILVAAFGVIVVLLTAPQLVRSFSAPAAAVRSLPPAATVALLLAGGVVHGAFATGGPMVVYVADRAALDKARFRATLSALWLVLGLLLAVGFAVSGTLTTTSAWRSLVLLVPVLIGLRAGEWLHRNVDALWFRRMVLLLLLLVGVVLSTREAFLAR